MKKGFTLLEVLIVIIIIGILATFAIPQYLKASRKAIASEAVTTIGSIRGSIARYYQEENAIPVLADLDIDDPNAHTDRWEYTEPAGTTPYNVKLIATGQSGTRAANLVVTYTGSDTGDGKTVITYNGDPL